MTPRRLVGAAATAFALLLLASVFVPQTVRTNWQGGAIVTNTTGTFFCAPIGTSSIAPTQSCITPLHTYLQNSYSIGGTLSSLQALLDPAQAGGTVTLTVYQNGGATGLTCQIAAGTTTCSDTTHTITVSPNDLLSLQIVIAAGANTINSLNWTGVFSTPQ
jgi:hypothetical protein